MSASPVLFGASVGHSLWFSEDLGESWLRHRTDVGGIYNECRCWCVATHQSQPGDVLAGTDQGLFRWSGERQQLEYVPSPMDDLQILKLAWNPDDPNFIVAGTRPAAIFITEDGGQSWRAAPLGNAVECFFINTPRVTSIRFDPTDSDTLWVTIEIDGLWRSRDRGQSWERLGLDLPDQDCHNLVIFEQRSPRRLLLSTEVGLFRSEDEGASWQHHPIPDVPHLYFRCLERRADASETVFLSVGDRPSGDTGLLLRSDDAGQNWRRCELPGTVNTTIWWISTHPADPNLIVAHSIFGELFLSQDGGDQWRRPAKFLGELREVQWAPVPRALLPLR